MENYAQRIAATLNLPAAKVKAVIELLDAGKIDGCGFFKLYRHILLQPLAFFTRNPTGTLMSRITYDVNLVRDTVSEAVTSILKDTFTLLALIFVIFYRDWKLAIIAVIVFPIAYFVPATPVHIVYNWPVLLTFAPLACVASVPATLRATATPSENRIRSPCDAPSSVDTCAARP